MEQKVIRENPILMRFVLRGLEKQYHPKFGFFPYVRMMVRLPYYTAKAWNYWRGRT
jgi:hypothetical protein